MLSCDEKRHFDLALDYNNQSLVIRRETLPTNHTDIADTLNNIAPVCSKKGELELALIITIND